MYFLSTKTIEKAYEELAEMQVSNSSIIQIFFILKACGYDSNSYKSTGDISKFGYEPAWHLCGLFSATEEKPSKYDFISPFSMKGWSNQSPSEPLKKWVSGRVKNNVIGGATTWRLIIDDDQKANQFKFNYNYVEELGQLTLKDQKINFFALSIWLSRFLEFPRKITPLELIMTVKARFKLNEEECRSFFSTDKMISLAFETHHHDSEHIRSLIGSPNGSKSTWITANRIKDVHKYNSINDVIEENMLEMSKGLSLTKIKKLLATNKQIILCGPPGSSKSFTARQISQDYDSDKIQRLQFHPKFSYEDFIGGYKVEGKEVNYIDGIFSEFIQKAENDPENKFLLIIDELNRANVGQVFGETIQCLDRDYTTSIKNGTKISVFSIPKNLFIIGTMNTSDRSIGNIDFAIKRRFSSVYTPSDPEMLIDICETDFGISCSDLLTKINFKLEEVLKDKELKIGHAIFLKEYVERDKLFIWNIENFELLFNFNILPMIEDYTRGNDSQMRNILGDKLPKRLSGEELINSLNEYLNS